MKNSLKGFSVSFVLSVLAAVLIFIGGIVWIVDRGIYDSLGLGGLGDNPFGFFGVFGTGYPFSTILGSIGVIIGVLVLMGACYIYLPSGYKMVGGITVLIFSLVSLIAAGGFFIGALLGIIGGILAMAGTRESIGEAVVKPKDQEEHERF